VYILKIKGNGKIPSHIQIRDEKQTLIAYFKARNLDAILEKEELLPYKENILAIIGELPYGKIIKI